MIIQVNKILWKRDLRLRCISNFMRYAHNEKQLAGVLYPLYSRKLLKVSGNDASVFLQGLITNDMKHFDEGAKSIYAMFLNNKGRVLYDTLIHKWEEKDSFMLECDKEILTSLQKHLKTYKLKRPIDIVDVNRELKLWVLISPTDVQKLEIDINRGLNIYKDPRLVDLGFRILSTVCWSGDQITHTVGTDVTVENSEEGYKYLRYKLGVNEGIDEIPPGSSFPLEANCDYLHGVSFHKGCYIGQELTARVHHTGVIRKRVMPLKFSETVNDYIEKDSVISASSNPKLNLGKLKAFARDYGLGLVRIKETLDAKELKIGNYSAKALKPSWWPIDAPKEKTTIKDQ